MPRGAPKALFTQKPTHFAGGKSEKTLALAARLWYNQKRTSHRVCIAHAVYRSYTDRQSVGHDISGGGSARERGSRVVRRYAPFCRVAFALRHNDSHALVREVQREPQGGRDRRHAGGGQEHRAGVGRWHARDIRSGQRARPKAQGTRPAVYRRGQRMRRGERARAVRHGRVRFLFRGLPARKGE